MATGVAAQNFSPISSINYDTLSQYQALGSQMELQASQAKNDRVRDGLQEAEKNRLLNQQNTGKIAGLLNSNPELMKQIDSGVAPKAVTQALKSYEKGGGNLNSTALLANYLGSSAEQIQNQQVLDLAEYQKKSAANTAGVKAQADLLEQQNKANQPQPLLFDAQGLEQFQSGQGSGGNFGVTPKNVGGDIMYQVGAQQLAGSGAKEMFMLPNELKALKDRTGMEYDIRPFVDPKTGKEGYMVGSSYNPAETYDQIYMSSKAKARGEADVAREDEIVNWAQTDRIVAEASMQKYNTVINGLKTRTIDIGGISEFVPDIAGLRESVRGAMNPSGQDAVDNVRSVVFLSLKAILGGQFSKDEANRLVSAAYNPQLTGEAGYAANIQRLELANSVLIRIYDAKMEELTALQSGIEYKGPSPSAVATSEINRLQQSVGDSMYLKTQSGLRINNIRAVNKK